MNDMNQIEWLNGTSDNGENCSNNQLAWLGWAPDENDDDVISLEQLAIELSRITIKVE